MAQKKILIGKVKGEPGEMGKFTSVTATVDDKVGVPSVDASISGEAGAQTLTLDFHNLKGMPGELSGTATNIVMGDGSEKSVEDFLTENIETIRTALGVVTKTQNGLVPMLPENPEVE